MRVDTARFGTIDVVEDQIFSFPMGMLGFAKYKRYIVLDHSENSPFKWLQSVEDGALAFIITDPIFFKADYHIELRRGEISIIEPSSEEELVLSVIMTIPESPQDMSANLMAPLIFNMSNRMAMQHVLTNSNYPVKYFPLRQPQGMTPAPNAGEPKPLSLR
ncbi:MAG: flagellar assembly protein FliW [Myxococcota bacterium]|nr:flagellar assembly protein FliW [Myxococcota bacterium]